MNAIALINVFQSANSILTKGVLRGGGDTKAVFKVVDGTFYSGRQRAVRKIKAPYLLYLKVAVIGLVIWVILFIIYLFL